jgi:hypothetical protein
MFVDDTGAVRRQGDEKHEMILFLEAIAVTTTSTPMKDT